MVVVHVAQTLAKIDLRVYYYLNTIFFFADLTDEQLHFYCRVFSSVQSSPFPFLQV